MTENPVARFQEWFREAEQAGVEVPEAMALATADADGAPSARMVLLKGADEDGFVFYSGYVSRKAGELEQNPRAALLFYWRPPGKQIRVEGRVERVSEAESPLAPAEASWRRGLHGRAVPSRAARSSRPATSSSSVNTKDATSRSRRTGAATGCGRRRSSSGSTARTGSTTVSVTRARARAGRWSGWRPSRTAAAT